MTRANDRLRGRVEAVLIGRDPDSLVTISVQKIQVVRGYGIQGDHHAGTRMIDARERELLGFGFLKGTEILNVRQFSAVSLEELTAIGADLHLPESIPFGSLGENLIVSGIPKFTELPPRTLLFFRKNENLSRTAVLTVWGENEPCVAPGQALQRRFPDSSQIALRFPRCAMGRRGVVGQVYCSGYIHAGDQIIVVLPVQHIYNLDP